MAAFKHIHMTLALISIIGFLIRSLWLFKDSNLLTKKLVKVLPHIIDTFLLASGIALMIISQQYPTSYPWLAIKIILIISYIVFGFKMFKSQQASSRAVFFVLAVASVAAVVYLAHFKPLI